MGFSLHKLLVVPTVARSVMVNHNLFPGSLASLDDRAVSLDSLSLSHEVGLGDRNTLDPESHLSLECTGSGSVEVSKMQPQLCSLSRRTALVDFVDHHGSLLSVADNSVMDVDLSPHHFQLGLDVSLVSVLSSDEPVHVVATTLLTGSSQVDDLLGLLASLLEHLESGKSVGRNVKSNSVVSDCPDSDV